MAASSGEIGTGVASTYVHTVSSLITVRPQKNRRTIGLDLDQKIGTTLRKSARFSISRVILGMQNGAYARSPASGSLREIIEPPKCISMICIS